jgi:glycosyltransferase involved in cell wall biosynthesis
MGYSLDIRHILIEDGGSNHPSAANGVHQVARRLVMEQNRAGDYSRIFFVPAGNNSEPPADVPVEVIAPTGPTVRGRPFAVDMSQTSPLLMGSTPDTVFHIHGVRHPLLVSLTYGLRKRRLPYAITCHSRYAHIFNHDGQIEYRRTAAYVHVLERPILEKARYVHTLTPLEAEEVRRLAPKASIVTIPNGVFSTRLDGTPPEPLLNPMANADFPAFGFFGRLAIEHKGLDLLVDGFAHYKRAGGAGKLQIMGTGDAARDELNQLSAAAGVSADVAILGPQFGPGKNELLKSWSYFVMPSRFDRMPLAALEAGLLGLPLLLNKETGIDVEQHGAGVLIPNLTPASIAATLAAAAKLTPEQWRARSMGAYRMVLSIADWTSITARLRELYRPSERPHLRPEALRSNANMAATS